MTIHLLLAALLIGDLSPEENALPTSAAVSDALFEGVEAAWASSSFACDYELTLGAIVPLDNRDSEPLTREAREHLRRILPGVIPFEEMDLSATPVEMFAAAHHRRPSRGVHYRMQDLQLIRKLPTAPPSMAAAWA